MSRKQPRYDDGLDADGYPLEHDPFVGLYRHGYEGDAGDWQPASLGPVIANLVDRARAAFDIGYDTTESPIEQHLGAAILLAFERRRKPLILAMDADGLSGGLHLIPQFRWSIYRSDWAIYNPKTSGALVIEADGKEFHSSIEQQAHDRKKDAAAHDRGYLSMRFTGSDIHRDADGCAEKIFQVVHGGRK